LVGHCHAYVAGRDTFRNVSAKFEQWQWDRISVGVQTQFNFCISNFVLIWLNYGTN